MLRYYVLLKIGNMKPYRTIWLIAGIIWAMSIGSGPAQADDVERLEILRQAPVSLGRAIEIALDKFPGYAVEGKLEEENGIFYYEIELVSEDGQAEVYVHPANGLIIGTDSEMGIAIRLQRRWEARLRVVSQSALSVLDVMTIAHRAASGRIMEIDLKKNRDEFFYRVTLYEGGSEHSIDVNADTGEIIRHEVAAS